MEYWANWIIANLSELTFIPLKPSENCTGYKIISGGVEVIRLNLFDIRSEIWRRSLSMIFNTIHILNKKFCVCIV